MSLLGLRKNPDGKNITKLIDFTIDFDVRTFFCCLKKICKIPLYHESTIDLRKRGVMPLKYTNNFNRIERTLKGIFRK